MEILEIAFSYPNWIVTLFLAVAIPFVLGILHVMITHLIKQEDESAIRDGVRSRKKGRDEDAVRRGKSIRRV